jgi:hypothetical protein
VLLGIARDFGVNTISRLEDFDNPGLVADVKAEERIRFGRFKSPRAVRERHLRGLGESTMHRATVVGGSITGLSAGIFASESQA